MGRLEKLLARLQTQPADFSWRELETLMGLLGYRKEKQGRTSGSRRKFVHPERRSILLHEPHGKEPLKDYQIVQLVDQLKAERIL